MIAAQVITPLPATTAERYEAWIRDLYAEIETAETHYWCEVAERRRMARLGELGYLVGLATGAVGTLVALGVWP